MASRPQRARSGAAAAPAPASSTTANTSSSSSRPKRHASSRSTSDPPELITRGTITWNGQAVSARFVMGGPRARKDDDDRADEDEPSDSDAEVAGHNHASPASSRGGSRPVSDKDEDEDEDVDMSPAPSASPTPSAASARNTSPNRSGTSFSNARGSPSPSPSPTPSTTTKDADGDEQMTDAQQQNNQKSGSKAAGAGRGQLTSSPSPINEDMTILPIPRKAIAIPSLPPKPERIMREDLPPYRRPVLRTEERVQDLRVVRVATTINEQVYPEQLIDPTKCRRATYVQLHPHGQQGAGGPGGSMMSPHLGARQVSALLPSHLPHSSNGAAEEEHKSISALHPSHLPPRTPRTTRNPAGAAIGHASPTSRNAGVAGCVPATPHQSGGGAQHGGHTQLTWPIPPARKLKHLSSIVTQVIPYGRIDIRPSAQPQLIASTIPRSSLGSLYLPHSRSATVYITLDLPGHTDYEIRLENLFVLPDAVDFERLKVQQRAIYAGEFDFTSSSSSGSASSTLPRASPMTIKDESGSNGALAKPMNKRSLSNTMSNLPTMSSTLQPIPFRLPASAQQLQQQNGNKQSRPQAVVRRHPSVRIGGHLERKRKLVSLDQQLQKMEQATISETDTVPTDALDVELAAAHATAPAFAPPALKDVSVMIKSKGRVLLPVPAHAETVPVYGEPTQAPKRAGKAAPAAGAAAGAAAASTTTVKKEGQPAPATPTPLVKQESKTEVKTEGKASESKTDAPAAAAASSSSTSGAAAGSSSYLYLPPPILSTSSIWVPRGPSTLSSGRPTLQFAHGSIHLERRVPRVGGWVVRGEETMERARKYRPIEQPEAPVKVEESKEGAAATAQAVKVEPGTPTASAAAAASPTPAAKKDTFKAALDKLEEQERLAHVSMYRKPRPIGSDDEEGVVKMEDVEPTPAAAVQADSPWQKDYAEKHTPLDRQWHDIAEVGDRVRLLINVPAPPAQPKSKPILPMQYEVVIEGLRIAPYVGAPEFPNTVELYRPGTAPKAAVETEALQTRLTASVVPSQRLIALGGKHWSEEGRRDAVRDPLLFPSEYLAKSSSEEEESSEEEDDEETKKQPGYRPKERTPTPPPSAAKLASAARSKFFSDFPQQNWDEWFGQSGRFTQDEAIQAEIDSENEALENHPSGDDSGDSGSGEEYSSSEGSASEWDEEELQEMERFDRAYFAKHGGDPGDEDDDEGERRAPGSGSRPTGSRFSKPSSSSGAGSSGKPLSWRDRQRAQMSSSKKSSSTDMDTSQDHPNESAPEAVWVACDKCGKWRKMPSGTDADSLPMVWYCRMNPDTTHNQCSHPEEEDPDAHNADFSGSSSTHGGGGGGGSSSGKGADQSAASSSSAAVARKHGKDANSGEKEAMSRHEKMKAEQAAAAAHAAHMALLCPNPRVPTIEDVCFACDKPLATEEERAKKDAEAAAENVKLRAEDHTLFCHGPCNRFWHRACAKIDPKHKAHVPVPTPPFVGKEPAAQPGVPHTTTHVVPFKPLETSYWFCTDCISLTSICFVCYQPGTIDMAQSRIMVNGHKEANPDFLLQCPYQVGCGKFYHTQCLYVQPRTMSHKGSRGQTKAETAATTPNLVPRPRAPLICALHTCEACGGAGTTSTNLRDVGRTLIQCLHCPSSVHWQAKCQTSDGFVVKTKKCGVCDRHRARRHGDPNTSSEDEVDFEDPEVKKRRLAAQTNVQLTFGKAPQHLFGSEPLPESESDEDGSSSEEEIEPPSSSSRKPAASKTSRGF